MAVDKSSMSITVTERFPRLEVDSSRPAPTGHRLLRFVLRECLSEGATEIWLHSQSDRLLILHKVDGSWRQLLNPVSFHQRQVINALRGLSDVDGSGRGLLRLTGSDGQTRAWSTSISPSRHGDEAFLRRDC